MDTNNCDGYKLSACCGAIIQFTDICSLCGEHTISQCVDCEDIVNCDDVK